MNKIDIGIYEEMIKRTNAIKMVADCLPHYFVPAGVKYMKPENLVQIPAEIAKITYLHIDRSDSKTDSSYRIQVNQDYYDYDRFKIVKQMQAYAIALVQCNNVGAKITDLTLSEAKEARNMERRLNQEPKIKNPPLLYIIASELAFEKNLDKRATIDDKFINTIPIAKLLDYETIERIE